MNLRFEMKRGTGGSSELPPAPNQTTGISGGLAATYYNMPPFCPGGFYPGAFLLPKGEWHGWQVFNFLAGFRR
jgi:hypothetical protein